MKYPPPSRTLWALTVIMMMYSLTTSSQSLKSAHATSVAAYSTFAQGLSALDWNPAGLVFIKDWQLDASYFTTLNSSTRSVSLQHVAAGKRFLGEHAAGMQLTPGSELEFVVPSTFVIQDSSNPVVSTYDKTINYAERYSLGYAVRLNDELALGFSARFLEEKITDTKYSVDTNSIIRSEALDYEGNAWDVDIGMLWNVLPSWKIGLTAKNLFHLTETQLPTDAEQYKLKTQKFLQFGLGYTGIKNINVGFDVDTKKQMRFGGELSLTDFLQLRGGMYFNTEDKLNSEAFAFGIGGSYQFVSADVSYLRFTNQTNRQGIVDINRFEESGIENLEINPYTGDRLTLSLSANLGKTHEQLARIEYVEMMSDVFPSSSSVHAFRAIGKARVRNVSSNPINAKVSFYVNRLMDSPTETSPQAIAANDVLEIPFYAVFSEAVKAISALAILDGEVFVTASPVQEYDDSYQARVLVHGRNDWNGDVTMLKYFITPSDPAVVRLTRNILSQAEAYLDTVHHELQLLVKAKLLFNEFVSKLVYVNDPKSSQDYVQYPSETLTLHGGDCDDMTVGYATLLSSVGIATAFVDVIPPEQPDNAHIYLMFDTGIVPSSSQLVSENPKRFVIRKNESGNESVWIPIETTVIRKGFDEAWRVGAEEFFRDAELNAGLVKGWVRVVDVQTVQ
ncbi:MAG: type IX secretion system membrane protein PorP/SprF [Ignavibacteriales bacterium]|nr:type IX secretion system membrane protein PorP/SprF [Ignavibacteriales bacterium]